MDILSIFEQKLKNKNQALDIVEKNWDQRAETFYHNQINGSTYFSEAVPRLLEQKGILQPSSTVLDICAGSGRYAIPFAKRCQSVLALDLSSEMLQYMKRETEKNNLDNLQVIQSAWPTKENIGEFDVAYSAMCPAMNSVEALKAMTSVANAYGVIAQFTSSTDSVIDALEKQQLIERNPNDPHNNRDHLQAYFNILWELGFNPEISYLHDTFTQNMTYEDALSSYTKRYKNVNQEDLGRVLKTIQQEKEHVEIIKNTTLAVLTWKTMRKGK